jgi:uncharacterized protein YjcR
MIALSTSGIGLLTIAEAASAAQVSPVTVRSWIRRDKLCAVQFMGHVHVVEIELYDMELLMRHSRKGRKRADH